MAKTKQKKSSYGQESQAFSDRLREALVGAGIKPSPTVIANQFNLRYYGKSITIHAARNWLLGISIPKQDKLQVLADWLQVSADALQFGGVMQRVSASTSNRAALAVRESSLADSLNLQDTEMVKRYLALSVDDRRTIREVVGAFRAKA